MPGKMTPKLSEEEGWVWMTAIKANGDCQGVVEAENNLAPPPTSLTLRGGEAGSSTASNHLATTSLMGLAASGTANFGCLRRARRPSGNRNGPYFRESEEPHRVPSQRRASFQLSEEHQDLSFGPLRNRMLEPPGSYTYAENRSQCPPLPRSCIPRNETAITATYLERLLPDFFDQQDTHNPEEWAKICNGWEAKTYLPVQAIKVRRQPISEGKHKSSTKSDNETCMHPEKAPVGWTIALGYTEELDNPGTEDESNQEDDLPSGH